MIDFVNIVLPSEVFGFYHVPLEVNWHKHWPVLSWNWSKHCPWLLPEISVSNVHLSSQRVRHIASHSVPYEVHVVILSLQNMCLVYHTHAHRVRCFVLELFEVLWLLADCHRKVPCIERSSWVDTLDCVSACRQQLDLIVRLAADSIEFVE